MESAESCPFCEELSRVKRIDESLAECDTRPGKTVIKYRVALVHELYYNGFPNGKTTSIPMDLKRCPVCGTEIESAEFSFGKGAC